MSWIKKLEAELRPTWEELKDEARRVMDAMSPVDLATMREAQRASFTYGNIKLHNPMLTREMVQDVIDEQDGVVRSTT
jgi:hypothetical protein